MKRRDFLTTSATILTGLASRAAISAAPCPHPSLSVAGGTTTSTSCSAGNAPAWFSAMADKTWTTIAATATIQSVLPAQFPGGNSSAAIMTAWCGGVVDTLRQELLIPAQGGHSDYYGNEVYSLALNTASPGWARLTNPRYSFGTGSAMDDGSPCATHGRCFMAYASNVDRIILGGMVGYAPQGNSNSDVYAFNRTAGTWQKRASSLINEGFEAGGVEYDSQAGYIWIVGAQAATSISRYDPTSNSHTAFNLYLNSGYAGATALSSSRRILLYLGGSSVGSGSFVWLDLNNLSAGWRQPTVTGAAPSGTGIGIRWHGTSGAFIAKGSGSSLYKLTPPANPVAGTWVWSLVPAAPSNSVTPTGEQPNGTYTRFNIVESLGGSGQDCLVLVNAINQSTYVYKLPVAGI